MSTSVSWHVKVLRLIFTHHQSFGWPPSHSNPFDLCLILSARYLKEKAAFLFFHLMAAAWK